jgi:hypothetical protein
LTCLAVPRDITAVSGGDIAMSDRVSELLLKAVRLLEQDEQDEVLRGLLRTGRAPDAAPGAVPARPMSSADRTARVVDLFGADPGGAEGGLKVLPVRLPAGDYDRLRDWSRRQGFSMAVVIRTLLERFLDEQAPSVAP